MPEDNKTEAYVSAVCAQVRWKKAHATIKQELQDHIEDQTQALLSQGVPQEQAMQRAILEMGDPIKVGMQFDVAYRPKCDKLLLFGTLFVAIIGLCLRCFFGPVSYVTDIGCFLLGIVGLLTAYQIDFECLWKKVLFLTISFYTSYLLLFGFGNIFSVLQQYKVYWLLCFPILLTAIIYSQQGKGWKGFLLCLLSVASILIIGGSIPYLAGMFICFGSALVLLTWAVCKEWFGIRRILPLCILYLPSIGVGIGVLLQGWHRIERLFVTTATNENYLLIMLRQVLQKAKWIGTANLPVEIESFLNNNKTDVFISYCISKVGLVFLIFISACLLLLVVQGFRLSLKQKNFFGKLLCCSIVILFFAEGALYLLSNMGFPIGTFPFPLISRGNVSLILHLIFIGILLSAIKHKDIIVPKRLATTQRKKWFMLKDGVLTINFR